MLKEYIVDTKVCIKCGVEKPLDEFYKRKGAKYGRQSWCKDCYKKRQNNSTIIYPPKMEGTKTCAKCGQEKPVAEFDKDKKRRDGRASYCKDCKRINRRKVDLKRLYNITPDEYNTMLKTQNYKCAICGKSFDANKRRLHIDHNHDTGKIRGLLCHQCNILIGMCSDEVTVLESAIEYLKNHNSLTRN